MHRTQLLLPPHLHREAAAAARARGLSLGGLVRDALTEYLARPGAGLPDDAALDEILLAPPADGTADDASVSVDHDHYLYGAPRKTRPARRR